MLKLWENTMLPIADRLEAAGGEIERLREEVAKWQTEAVEWLKANSPGGWIDELRQHARRELGECVEENKKMRERISELEAASNQSSRSATAPMSGA